MRKGGEPRKFRLVHRFHAVKNRVPFFATVDQRSILKHAGRIEAAFSIKVGKPSDVVKWLGIRNVTRAG